MTTVKFTVKLIQEGNDLVIPLSNETCLELGWDVGDVLTFESGEDGSIVISKNTPQRHWIGLTDEDRQEIKNVVIYDQFETAGEYARRVQAAIEAKLKEKNTLTQTQTISETQDWEAVAADQAMTIAILRVELQAEREAHRETNRVMTAALMYAESETKKQPMTASEVDKLHKQLSIGGSYSYRAFALAIERWHGIGVTK